MKKTFEQHLYEVMKSDERLVLLTADDSSPELTSIYRDFPARSYRFGISECNLVGAAAGLAKMGFIPVVYTFAPFLVYRAYEFIRCDICVNSYNVKLVGYCSGVKGNNYGPTHHATEDIALLRVLPNITLLSPASQKETEPVLKAAIAHTGPVYIRMGKGFETEVFTDTPAFTIGKSEKIRCGDDVTFVATGNIIANVLDAADMLQAEGIHADIINLSSIKPFDKDTVLESIRRTGKVITVEEHQVIGGIGSAVAECIAESGIQCSFMRMGFLDKFATEYGWHKDILAMNNLSPESIHKAAHTLLGK